MYQHGCSKFLPVGKYEKKKTYETYASPGKKKHTHTGSGHMLNLVGCLFVSSSLLYMCYCCCNGRFVLINVIVFTTFLNEPNSLSVQCLNRTQNHLLWILQLQEVLQFWTCCVFFVLRKAHNHLAVAFGCSAASMDA